MDGYLLINKEKGITSYDVIRKVKHLLYEKGVLKGQKIGHAGTLDPFATGVLILLLGRVTKQFDNIQKMHKTYEVTAEFGFQTDTQDITGKIVHEAEDSSVMQVTLERLKESIKAFAGNISQIPPVYSAKKVNGVRACDLARKGTITNLSAVDVQVYSFEVVKYDWPRVIFKVVCSSGTYIRTLVNDLGIKLGTYATALELCRKKIGDFDIADSISTKDLINYEDIVNNVKNINI